ncbi:iojap-like protein [Thioalkalivibrio sulfidiphilus HL-EbGr7]|uniref:Ribosomal silencing factor RsfS n=1 Tax=Thioalkalivibrio sulfidiphilus (strain HL-EbGR7) TaxID=396588 RepID=B8GV08_THISH|nr:ribosome silencing factor [Thioalkalivibrio sulfidiphilus]ACL73354.1 iojap-like protein [Thioalkalivibrio sulfidiphilus HL-EbGr7]
MQTEELTELVIKALEDLKGQDIKAIDVRGKTAITDMMVIASGTSDRHVKALADSVVVKAKEAGVMPLGTEGQGDNEWVLVDLNDVVVHVMLPRVRDFYNLEKLWLTDASAAEESEPVTKVKRLRR